MSESDVQKVSWEEEENASVSSDADEDIPVVETNVSELDVQRATWDEAENVWNSYAQSVIAEEADDAWRSFTDVQKATKWLAEAYVANELDATVATTWPEMANASEL